MTNRPCQQEGSATGTKEMLDLFSENRTMDNALFPKAFFFNRLVTIERQLYVGI